MQCSAPVEVVSNQSRAGYGPGGIVFSIADAGGFSALKLDQEPLQDCSFSAKFSLLQIDQGFSGVRVKT